MNKGVALGASALALMAMVGTAEARKVHYEIDGQRYSYSTNNRQQVREARERMAAAAAGSARTGQSETPAPASPLARLFGPQPGQGGAAGAPGPAIEPPQQGSAHSETTGSITGRNAEGRRIRDEARAEKVRERHEARAERRRLAARHTKAGRHDAAVGVTDNHEDAVPQHRRTTDAAADRLATLKAEGSKRADGAARRGGGEATPAPHVTPELAVAKPLDKAAIKSVSFDVESGIKTVQMKDGSIHEELFDESVLLGPGKTKESDAESLTSFVNQLRRPPSGEEKSAAR